VSIAFSLIIPALNESQRLPSFLPSVRGHLSDRYGGSYEVIVVDDGSTDDTADVLRELARDWPQLKPISHAHNQGKGAAVKTGMLAARGDVLLFADADGATPIREERRLRLAIDAGADVAVGSRRIASADVRRDRDWKRAIAGSIFTRFARMLVPVSVGDTQCGFKMFRFDAAQRLFGRSRETGYLFDLELLKLADEMGFWIAEVPISWTEMPDGKLNMRREWRNILTGLCRLRKRFKHASEEDSRRA
jgi:glycosyltransferase involved in cell wall biosynthesis